MRIVEPYNSDQASDAVFKVVVPGVDAGDCVVRLEVTPTKYWDIRLDNDANDNLMVGYAGGTAIQIGSGNSVTIPVLSTPALTLTAAFGTGTVTSALGSLAPSMLTRPEWRPITCGTTAGYIPFFPAT